MQGDVHDIEISPDGDNLIVASDNGGCKIINATNGNMVADLWQGRTNNGVYEVAWSNDDNRVFCGGFDATLSSYHTSNWSLEANYSGLPGWISGIDTTPDGRLVFVASYREVSAFGYLMGVNILLTKIIQITSEFWQLAQMEGMLPLVVMTVR